jgi:hypothetical protein
MIMRRELLLGLLWAPVLVAIQFKLTLKPILEAIGSDLSSPELDDLIGFAYEVLPLAGHFWTKEHAVCAWLELIKRHDGADTASTRAALCFSATVGMMPIDISVSGSYTFSAAIVPKGLTSLDDSELLSDVVRVSFDSTSATGEPRTTKLEPAVLDMRTRLIQHAPSEQRESLWEVFHEQVRQLLLNPDGDPFMIRTKPELRAFMEPCVPSACVEQLQLLQAHPRWSQVNLHNSCNCVIFQALVVTHL